ncbi:hypothetical protein YC2023_051530 [Brassica napus]
MRKTKNTMMLHAFIKDSPYVKTTILICLKSLKNQFISSTMCNHASKYYIHNTAT